MDEDLGKWISRLGTRLDSAKLFATDECAPVFKDGPHRRRLALIVTKIDEAILWLRALSDPSLID